MRLSNLPDNVTNKMIEDQSAEACTHCEGRGKYEVDNDHYKRCERCDGSGIEPKRFYDQEREDTAFGDRDE